MEKGMNKSKLTIQELNDALHRILSKQTLRISPERKLSIKAVEEEANLGDGTAYYYKDVIKEIKKNITQNKSLLPGDTHSSENSRLRINLKKESQLKDKYRDEVKNLKIKLSQLAAQNNEFAISIQQYEQRVLELESNVGVINK
jgi:hypothetical protein